MVGGARAGRARELPETERERGRDREDEARSERRVGPGRAMGGRSRLLVRTVHSHPTGAREAAAFLQSLHGADETASSQLPQQATTVLCLPSPSFNVPGHGRRRTVGDEEDVPLFAPLPSRGS